MWGGRTHAYSLDLREHWWPIGKRAWARLAVAEYRVSPAWVRRLCSATGRRASWPPSSARRSGAASRLAALRRPRCRTRLGRPRERAVLVLRAAEQERPDVVAARQRWRAQAAHLDGTRLVFVDETAVQTDPPLRAESPRHAPRRPRPARPLEDDDRRGRAAGRRAHRPARPGRSARWPGLRGLCRADPRGRHDAVVLASPKCRRAARQAAIPPGTSIPASLRPARAPSARLCAPVSPRLCPPRRLATE